MTTAQLKGRTSRPTRTRRLRSWSVGLLAGAVALSCVAACSSSGGSKSGGGNTSGGSSNAKLTEITVALPPLIDSLYGGLAQGFFAQHGLKVNIKNLNGGSAIDPALESGAVQIGGSNILSEVQAAQQGFKIPCFAGDSVLPASGHLFSLLTSSKANISSPADLKGKTIAINAIAGVSQVVMDKYLESKGVAYKSVHYVALGYPDMPAALSGNRVAAALVYEPYVTIASQQGSKILDPTPYSVISSAPMLTCWNATQKWLKGHEDVARNFVAAITQADAWAKANPAAYHQVLLKYTETPKDLINKITIQDARATITAADVNAWVNPARTYGIITKPVDMANVIYPLAS